MKTLKYCGQVGGPFGWGVFGREITKALAQHFTLTDGEADVCFVPCVDHELTPAVALDPTRLNIGMTFFEYPLGEKAVENAGKFDALFCGSTWCLDRLWERGIAAKVLIQGVDHEIFCPGHRYTDSIVNPYTLNSPEPQVAHLPPGFLIFSGGKFEWRKGQDLVIGAFAKFAAKHSDAHLVCSWFNPWPALIFQGIEQSGLGLPIFLKEQITQEELFEGLMMNNGIPRDRFTVLPRLDQPALADAMRQTDVGLFPNRCEGGTNLVMMEYFACGGRIVANEKTGHADVCSVIDFIIPATEDESKWAVSSVAQIIETMEEAYDSRHVEDSPGVKKVNNYIRGQWTWAAAAAKVAEEVERLWAIK